MARKPAKRASVRRVVTLHNHSAALNEQRNINAALTERCEGLAEQIGNLNRALETRKVDYAEAVKNGSAWRDQAKATEKARDDALAQLALSNADRQRLKGYLDRVLEDDAIRDASKPRQPEMGRSPAEQPEPRRGPILSDRGMSNW